MGHDDVTDSSTPERYKEENARAAALVRRAVAGDRRAFTELISMYDRRVLVKLRKAVREPDRIKDLRQEVWLRALEAIRKDKITQPERFCGFLYGVAQNVVHEDAKDRNRHIVVDIDVAVIGDGGATVENLLDRDFLSRHLHACLDSMVPRDREVVIRHYLRQDDRDQTQRQLGLTSVHYSRVLHRAGKRLASLLEVSLAPEDLDASFPASDILEPGCEKSGPRSPIDDQV